MPFQSRSQLRKFGSLVGRGEMSAAEFKKWRDETPNIGKLPERKPKTLKEYGKKRDG